MSGATRGIRTLKRKDERSHDDLKGSAKAYNKMSHKRSVPPEPSDLSCVRYMSDTVRPRGYRLWKYVRKMSACRDDCDMTALDVEVVAHTLVAACISRTPISPLVSSRVGVVAASFACRRCCGCPVPCCDLQATHSAAWDLALEAVPPV